MKKMVVFLFILNFSVFCSYAGSEKMENISNIVFNTYSESLLRENCIKSDSTRKTPKAKFIKKLKEGKKITIVTMGTSLTGGTWRWTDVMMSDWLDKDFPGQVTLYNEGIGASACIVGPGNNKSLSGLGKLHDVIKHKPDVVFIEFAINDAYIDYHISLEDSKKYLNLFIDSILFANPNTEIILQTMNSVKDDPKYGNHASARPQISKYMQGYRDVAKSRNLILVDHYPNWEKLMNENPEKFDSLVPDRIHPQAEGYRQILLPELKIVLENKE
jgi:lysophospholipase L1-like esterase